MKKLIFSLLVLSSVITVGGIQSCQTANKTSSESKLFKFNLQEGKGYDYEMVWDIDMKQGGQGSAVSMTALFSMNIKSIEGGVRSVATTYKSIRLIMDVMGTHMEMDSDKAPADNGSSDPKENPLGMMNKIVGMLVGKEFIIKVNDEGKVLEVTGFKEILSDMMDSMGMKGEAKEQAMAGMGDQFSEQSIKDQFAQVFNIFPNKEVKVGDSWEKNYTTGGKMGSTHNTTYTVKEIEGDHVSLSTKTKMSSREDGENIEGTQTGNIIVDSKTGLMISGDFDQDIRVKTEGQNINVTGKGKIKGKAN